MKQMTSRYVHTLGDLVRNHRMEQKRSATEVAKFVGISPKWLCDIELNRKPPPRYDILLRIAMYLRIDEKDLFWSAARWWRDHPRKRKIKYYIPDPEDLIVRT